MLAHTPTQTIEDNPNPGGRLAALCLDTGEEFYSSPNEMEGEVASMDVLLSLGTIRVLPGGNGDKIARNLSTEKQTPKM